mgnify:CR=1 FL=1
MMTETLKNQKALIDAGFSESDIASWQVQQRQALSDAGYNQAQIDTEFGEPPLFRAPLRACYSAARCLTKPWRKMRRWPLGSQGRSGS